MLALLIDLQNLPEGFNASRRSCRPPRVHGWRDAVRRRRHSLLFQDIGPQARLERHWGPTVGAVVGFTLGLLGDALIHGS